MARGRVRLNHTTNVVLENPRGYFLFTEMAGYRMIAKLPQWRDMTRSALALNQGEDNGFDNLPFSVVSRIGAAHDAKARHPKTPVSALRIVSIFDTKSHDD